MMSLFFGFIYVFKPTTVIVRLIFAERLGR
jgi:hypothetical protein